MTLLSTARLTLRPLSLADAEYIFDVRGDPEVMRFWDWWPDTNMQATKLVVAGLVDELISGTSIYWVARTHLEQFAGLHDLSQLKSDAPEIGFMVPRSSWGQGYGMEAAQAVVLEAWRRGFVRLKARVHADNERSIRLLGRLGFMPSGSPARVEVRPRRHVLCHFYHLQKPSLAHP